MTGRRWSIRFEGGLAVAIGLAIPANAAPSITAGAIATLSVNVRIGPATPAVKLTVDAPAGVHALSAGFISPAGQGYNESWIAAAPSITSGTITLQPAGQQMPFQAQAGTWQLSSVTIADGAGALTAYAGPQLAAWFPSLALTVINKGSDTTPPAVTAGTILTPTVKLSSAKPYFEAGLTVMDLKAGVKSGSIELMSPDGKVVVAEGYGAAPVKNGKLLVAAKLTTASGATGTWKVLACEALDVANMFAAPANCASLFSPATFIVAN